MTNIERLSKALNAVLTWLDRELLDDDERDNLGTTQEERAENISDMIRNTLADVKKGAGKLDIHIVLDALATAARGQPLDPETCQTIESIAKDYDHKDFTSKEVHALYSCGYRRDIPIKNFPVAYIVNPDGTIEQADLTFKAFLAANIARQKDWPSESWTLAQWMVALTGELGEAANIVKKMWRGDMSPEEGKIALGKELADVQTYLSITADKAGIDLPAATIAKFNEVSDRIGSDVKIPLPSAAFTTCAGDVQREQVEYFIVDHRPGHTNDEGEA